MKKTSHLVTPSHPSLTCKTTMVHIKLFNLFYSLFKYLFYLLFKYLFYSNTYFIQILILFKYLFIILFKYLFYSNTYLLFYSNTYLLFYSNTYFIFYSNTYFIFYSNTYFIQILFLHVGHRSPSVTHFQKFSQGDSLKKNFEKRVTEGDR